MLTIDRLASLHLNILLCSENMSATSTIPEDTQCTQVRNHEEEDHSLEIFVHKCMGEECAFCVTESNRCQYRLMTFQVWVEVDIEARVRGTIPK